MKTSNITDNREAWEKGPLDGYQCIDDLPVSESPEFAESRIEMFERDCPECTARIGYRAYCLGTVTHRPCKEYLCQEQRECVCE